MNKREKRITIAYLIASATILIACTIAGAPALGPVVLVVCVLITLASQFLPWWALVLGALLMAGVYDSVRAGSVVAATVDVVR